MVELDEQELPIPPGGLLADRYLIGQPIGVGGMGLVVAAEDKKLRQKVAVKFLSRAIRGDSKAVARFVREAMAAAQIRSEHVVRVTDVSGPYSETPYLVMELLVGQDLASLLAERGRLPADEAVGYVLQACEAIAEAHAAGIIHRDLKPSNLFLTRRRDGSPLVKVVDFGISKLSLAEGGAHEAPAPGTPLTLTAAVMGSPKYMSPEQLRSTKNVDARADIWSLGVILHELVTGAPPYEGESLIGQIAMIAADPPTPIRRLHPELPATLEAAILSCLAKDPADRPADVATLARKLAPLAPRWASFSVERITGEAAAAPGAWTTPTPSGELRVNAGGSRGTPTRTLVASEGPQVQAARAAPSALAAKATPKAKRGQPSRRALFGVVIAAAAVPSVGVLVYLRMRPPLRQEARAESPSDAKAIGTEAARSPTRPVPPPAPSLLSTPAPATEPAADKPTLAAEPSSAERSTVGASPPTVVKRPPTPAASARPNGPRHPKTPPPVEKSRDDVPASPAPTIPKTPSIDNAWDKRH